MQFYFRDKHAGIEHTYALISVWSEPNPRLLEESSQAVYACAYRGQDNLLVIEAKTIFAVVAMIPMQPAKGDYSPLFFLVDKPGLDTLSSADVNNEYDEE